jgi:hypothetical protein
VAISLFYCIEEIASPSPASQVPPRNDMKRGEGMIYSDGQSRKTAVKHVKELFSLKKGLG